MPSSPIITHTIIILITITVIIIIIISLFFVIISSTIVTARVGISMTLVGASPRRLLPGDMRLAIVLEEERPGRATPTVHQGDLFRLSQNKGWHRRQKAKASLRQRRQVLEILHFELPLCSSCTSLLGLSRQQHFHCTSHGQKALGFHGMDKDDLRRPTETQLCACH